MLVVRGGMLGGRLGSWVLDRGDGDGSTLGAVQWCAVRATACNRAGGLELFSGAAAHRLPVGLKLWWGCQETARMWKMVGAGENGTSQVPSQPYSGTEGIPHRLCLDLDIDSVPEVHRRTGTARELIRGNSGLSYCDAVTTDEQTSQDLKGWG